MKVKIGTEKPRATIPGKRIRSGDHRAGRTWANTPGTWADQSYTWGDTGAQGSQPPRVRIQPIT